MLSKASGLWRPVVDVQAYSPGFETNDIGFMQRADIISPSAVMQYVNQTVTPHFREKDMFVGVWENRNFDGDVLDHGVYINWFGTTSNYWTPNFTLLVTPESFDDRLTRGGPVAKSAFYWSSDASIGTDTRKNFSAQISAHRDGARDGSFGHFIVLTLNARPKPNLQLSVAPKLNRGHNTTQYVTAFDDPAAVGTFGRRYVFATLDERTFELDTRAVGIEEKYLPWAGADLATVRVLDAAGRQIRQRVGEADGGERHVIDHAGFEIGARTAADDVQNRR